MACEKYLRELLLVAIYMLGILGIVSSAAATAATADVTVLRSHVGSGAVFAVRRQAFVYSARRCIPASSAAPKPTAWLSGDVLPFLTLAVYGRYLKEPVSANTKFFGVAPAPIPRIHRPASGGAHSFGEVVS